MKLFLSILLLLLIVGVAAWIISKSISSKRKKEDNTADNKTPGVNGDNQTTPVGEVEHSNAIPDNHYLFFISPYCNLDRPYSTEKYCFCVAVTKFATDQSSIKKLYRFNGSYYPSLDSFSSKNINRFKDKCKRHSTFEEIEKFARPVNNGDKDKIKVKTEVRYYVN